MSSFPILDLVVGMIFIYFLLSIISSSAVEMILTGFRIRARVLEEWLVTIFDKKIKKRDDSETTLGQEIMDHCAVTALSKKGKPPSYIDAKIFASALIERITYDPANPKSVAKNLDDIITALNNTTILSIELQRTLLGYAYAARDTYAELNYKTISEVEYFRYKIEHWFDTTMDRVTGTLKTRYARHLTLIAAVLTAALLNADSIAIAKYLYSNPAARTQLAAQTYKAANDTSYLHRLNQIKTSPGDSVTLEQVKAGIANTLVNVNAAEAALETSIPLGWKKSEMMDEAGKLSPAKVFTKTTGLLATILAIFMGAPFWFDLLNKIANLRGTGPKPASTADINNLLL